MTATILTQIGQVLQRLMYRPLILKEVADEDGLDVQEQYMARVYKKWGSWFLPRELDDIGLEMTSQYDPYEEETQNEQSFPQ